MNVSFDAHTCSNPRLSTGSLITIFPHEPVGATDTHLEQSEAAEIVVLRSFINEALEQSVHPRWSYRAD
ncbi:MAG: hypothetical protein DMF90_09200 [Acidobacteria bacterium]|nr:MAG: hypothetical protein DMF90_09200 [Acidobacteriota bacterium]